MAWCVWKVSPEGGVVVVVLDSDGLHLWPSVSHEAGQFLRHLLRFLVHWGGDFKQLISTGTQFKLLLNCLISVYCRWRNKRGTGGGTSIIFEPFLTLRVKLMCTLNSMLVLLTLVHWNSCICLSLPLLWRRRGKKKKTCLFSYHQLIWKSPDSVVWAALLSYGSTDIPCCPSQIRTCMKEKPRVMFRFRYRCSVELGLPTTTYLTDLREHGVVLVVFQSFPLKLGTAFSNESSQPFDDLDQIFILWGGNFKQAMSMPP